MTDNSLKIGAGVGLVAGAGAGLIKGTKSANKLLAPYTPALKAGKIGSETFTKEQTDYVTNGINTLIEKGKEVTPKIAYKLKDGFRRMVEHLPDVQKAAKNTKIKWVAGLAAAGTAVGAVIAAIANKIKSSKQENV